LTIDAEELFAVVPLYLVVGLILGLASRRNWLERTGIVGWLADLGFYAAFGLVVTSSVAMAGVLLVFSFLIIPALVGLLSSRAPGRQLMVGWGVGGMAAASGLLASYALDTSTGATMVCAFALVLGIALVIRVLVGANIGWAKAATLSGGLAAALLLASTLWLVAQPRADHPLLDALEAVWPALRDGYFSEQEKVIYADAENQVQRYAGEAARLTAIEARSRWQGAALDDESVRKISSFQQSYNEMIKGERFVMREMRSRARERLRWPLAVTVAGLLTAMLTLSPFWRGRLLLLRRHSS
jgi:zinc/manganese transport system permease protein